MHKTTIMRGKIKLEAVDLNKPSKEAIEAFNRSFNEFVVRKAGMQ